MTDRFLTDTTYVRAILADGTAVREEQKVRIMLD